MTKDKTFFIENFKNYNLNFITVEDSIYSCKIEKKEWNNITEKNRTYQTKDKIREEQNLFEIASLKDIKFDISYLKMCEIWGQNSYCERKKVGALLVKDKNIISDGYNGCPSGMTNQCEDENGNTHWYVLHAESNLLSKLAKNNFSSEDSILYITLSPCKECSKLLVQCGIKKVIFTEFYRDLTGLELLLEKGIELIYYNLDLVHLITIK